MSGAPDNNTPTPADTGTHTPAPAAEGFDTEFTNLFRHDPFPKSSEGTNPPKGAGAAIASPAPASRPGDGTATPVAPAPTTNQPVAAQPVVTTAQPAPQTTAVPSPEAQALRDAAQALTASATAMRQPQGQPQGPQADPSLDYLFEMPQEVAAALVNENPQVRIKAHQFVNAAMAKEVHSRIRNEFLQYAQTEVPKMIQSMLSAHTFRQNIQQDFYGKYPQFKSEALAPVVASITQKVLQSQPAGSNVAWNDSLRDQIANEIFALIPALRSNSAPNTPAPQVNSPSTPVSQPPRIFSNGARPGSSQTEVEDQIMKTLFAVQH